jgi:hypothetical protein
MAEIRSTLTLNPLPPSHPPDGQAVLPILQLRPRLSKYAAERRADDRHESMGKRSSSRAIRDELAKVAAVWDKIQRTRARDAVYSIFASVLELARDWERRGRADRKGRRALRLHGLKAPKHIGPLAAILAATSDADIKTRSKWGRALGYVAACAPKHESLIDFMKRNGGINGCASLARRTGRRSK